VCLPNGFGDAGLPTSTAFMWPALSEKTLLDLANAYQKETDWHRQRPPVG
jgi:aspartyl-tRNA(Asn)/glutamyl-tRNA(Gln) amidotransferase subunit A